MARYRYHRLRVNQLRRRTKTRRWFRNPLASCLVVASGAGPAELVIAASQVYRLSLSI